MSYLEEIEKLQDEQQYRKERLKELETELEAVRQERDEAREVARELYHHPDRHRELWYRWLKEEK